MELVLLELVCWAGLLFFFWALKEGLSQVESDIESLGLVTNGRHAASGAGGVQFESPERVEEPIGTWRDTSIYRFAVIRGRTYQFDRIYPPESGMKLDPDERCIAPGIVYQECSAGLMPQ